MTDPAGHNQSDSVAVYFSGAPYQCAPGETVLDALLRQKVDLPYSCRKGTCLSCILKADGPVPAAAQEGLRPTLVDQGYFLPCLCPPIEGLTIEPAVGSDLFLDVKIDSIEKLAAHITRISLTSPEGFEYQAGQFINLRREDGLTRSYSLASVPGKDKTLDLHVKQLENGLMSNWVADSANVGDTVQIQGPNGACFYLDGHADSPLLMIGNGAGLAPLRGIIHDALNRGHKGDIYLYHGSRHAAGLYLREELARLSGKHANFHYHPCLSGAVIDRNSRGGRAENVAFDDHQNLKGCHVYLCGYPPMVESARKTAFLKGADLDSILCDAFELRELRTRPRR